MNPHVPPEPDMHPEADLRFTSSTQPDFQAAARHGTRVRWIKRALPIVVLVAALGIGASVVVSYLGQEEALPVDLGRLTLAGTSLTMERPHLSGFTDDERGYSLTARTASQDLKKPDQLMLSGLEARMDLADKGWVTLAAVDGVVNIKEQVVHLSRNINVAMSGGYRGRLHRAQINVKKGELQSNMPVTFTYLDDAKLTADALTVLESGDRAIFTGNVQVDFVPAKLRQQAADTPSSIPGGAKSPTTKPAPTLPPAVLAPIAPSSPAQAATVPASPVPAASIAPTLSIPPPAPPAAAEAPQAVPPTAPAQTLAALAQPEATSPPAVLEHDIQEGPVPTALVPLPPRRPVIQADLLPPAYAPLPPRKPVPYP